MESGPVGIRTRDLLLSSFADANMQGKRSTAGLRAHRMYTKFLLVLILFNLEVK